jgi:hypothetical protein
MGSPVPLSSEAVGVITRLRNMKVSVPAIMAIPVDIDSLTIARTRTRIGADGETLFFAPKEP